MKWIRRIMIEDFQSHRLTDIEFVEGFNVIVGPSDQGKTAILRAIRWVLFNEPRGNDFIRVGATKAKVSLIMNDGTIVSRERSSSRNRYTIAVPGEEEQIYEGFGHTVPDDVKTATGVQLMKIDEDHQVAIQLGMQLDPPFLLDSNGSIKAKAIGRVNGVHILDYAHKTTSSELNSKQTEERRLQTDLGKVNEQLQAYEDLDHWQFQLELMEDGLKKADQLEYQTTVLQDRKNRKEEFAKKLRLAEEYLAKLAALDEAEGKWILAQEIELKEERFIRLHKRLEETRSDLSASSKIIRSTESLKKTTILVEEAESKLALEQRLLKANMQKIAIQKETLQNKFLLSRTDCLHDAEQQLIQLERVQDKESQLYVLKSKQEEYQSLDKKITLVLNKTYQLDLAEKKWNDGQDAEHRFESLLIYQKRGEDLKNQMVQMESTIHRTSHIHESEQKWKRSEQIAQQLDVLHQLNQKLTQTMLEKNNLEHETIRIERKLEEYAKQYYEQLKNMGRCPICLGEVEDHTVDRIVAELSS